MEKKETPKMEKKEPKKMEVKEKRMGMDVPKKKVMPWSSQNKKGSL